MVQAIFLAVILGVHAFAEPLVCSDPLKAVCGSIGVHETANQDSLSILKQAVDQTNAFLGERLSFENFISQLKKDLELGPSAKDKTILYRGILHGLAYTHCADYLARASFSKRTDSLSCFTQPLDRSKPFTLAGILSLFRAPQADDDTGRAINATLQQVARVVTHFNFGSNMTSFLTAELQATQRVSFSEYLSFNVQILLSQKTNDTDVFSHLFNQCDLDLIKKDAFNYAGSVGTLPSGVKVHGAGLVICPSMWIGAEGPNIFVLAHEIGHTLGRELSRFKEQDSIVPNLRDEGSLIYQHVLSCMDERYVKTRELSVSYPSFESKTQKSSFMKLLTFNPEKFTAELFYQEHFADLIATEVASLDLETKSDLEGATHAIVQQLKILCGAKGELNAHDPISGFSLSETDRLHPSPKFRLETMFFDSEALRNHLKCTSQARVQDCNEI